MLNQVRRTSRQEHCYPVRGHASSIVRSKLNVFEQSTDCRLFVRLSILQRCGDQDYIKLGSNTNMNMNFIFVKYVNNTQ